jgi:hypothetical protein
VVRRRTRNKRIDHNDDYEGHGRVVATLELVRLVHHHHGTPGVATANGMYSYERMKSSCGWEWQAGWRFEVHFLLTIDAYHGPFESKIFATYIIPVFHFRIIESTTVRPP